MRLGIAFKTTILVVFVLFVDDGSTGVYATW